MYQTVLFTQLKFKPLIGNAIINTVPSAGNHRGFQSVFA